MAFRPELGDELTVGERAYHVAEHPAAPGMAYGQTGRRGTVYQLVDQEENEWALKVFLRQYREPRLVGQTERIRDFAALPGLRVSEREVLTSIQHVDLIREHMDLAYAVLMPWISGKTWIEIVVGREEWGADRSLAMVGSLLPILARMEERGIAHCDLSGSNLILTPEGQVELVDLEEMYATDLRRPIALPGGSPGYAHKIAPEGLWQPEADRFAGAILIAEMLGWCDARVVDAAWGEGYFEPSEMQTNGERYYLLKGVLQERWGERVGELFEAAWFSDTLSLCPTFTEWLAALPEEVPEVVPEADRESEPETEIEDVGLLILQAERESGKGEIDEALSLLKRAEKQATGKLLIEIRARVGELEGEEASEEGIEKEERWRCSECGRMVPDEAEVCPYCEQSMRPDIEEDVAQEAVFIEEPSLPPKEETIDDQPKEMQPKVEKFSQIQKDREHFVEGPLPSLKDRRVWGGLVVIVIFGLIVFKALMDLNMSSAEPTSVPTKTSKATASKQSSPVPTSIPPTTTVLPVAYYGDILPEGAIARLGKGAIGDLSLSPQGDVLAVGSSIGIYYYRWDTMEQIRFDEYYSTINSIAFSPDGKVLASGSRDGIVILWDVKTGSRLHTLEGHEDGVRCVAFSPDGNSLTSASDDANIILWDVESGNRLLTMEGHSDRASTVSFSPDGGILASGSGDKTVILWDVGTGKRLRTLEGHTNRVINLAFSPVGDSLASGSSDGTVILWDVQSGNRLHTLEGHTYIVSSVAFSPDGDILASGSWDCTIILWEVETGKRLRTLEGHTGSVYSVAYSPDGDSLASASFDGTVIKWVVGTGKRLRTLEGHSNYVWSVDFSPNGDTLASGLKYGTVILWNVLKGERVRTLQCHTGFVYSLAFSLDGKFIACGTEYGNVALLDVDTGNRLITLERHTDHVYGLAFSPDGGKLASASGDGDVILWDVETSKHLYTLGGHTGGVWSVDISSSESCLASGSSDRTIILWDLETGKQLRTLEGHEGSVMSIDVSPSCEVLASGSTDGTVILWDVETGNKLHTLEGDASNVWSVAFSKDGKVLASGSTDGKVYLWDVRTGEKLDKLEGHTDRVMSLAFSPDGDILASGSWDGTVLLWDME